MATVSQDTFQDLTRITLDNGILSCSLLPELGGKMISLLCSQTGREHLFSSGRPFRKPTYETDYEELDISGFDECFPSIAPAFYPERPWQGTRIPDHGELFTLKWKPTIEKHCVRLTAYGMRFPYRFSRRLSLHENEVRINYELENLSSYVFKYLWSAHPLFAVDEGTRIMLPGNPKVRTDFSKYERFGRLLYETTWPLAKQADGSTVDVSLIRTGQEDAATKLFTTPLTEGWCGLRYPDGAGLTMLFDVKKAPYVGLWINEGGWPFTGQSCFHVALEPCTGCPDSLATAIQTGECCSLDAEETCAWDMTIRIEKPNN